MHLLLFLFLALQASTAPPRAADPFAALRDQWAKDLHAKHIDDSLAQYADDADFISDAGRTHGMPALRQLFQTITATMDSDHEGNGQRPAREWRLPDCLSPHPSPERQRCVAHR